MITFFLGLHALAAIVWVGGMFFAHMILRPVLMGLTPPERLKVWRGVLPRFFAWIWATILALLASGYFVVFEGYGGFAGSGLHIHIMHATGLAMMALFVLLNLVPFRRFLAAYDAGDLPKAGQAMNAIRLIVTINLILGLVTAAIGSTGPLWG
jgi:uncharacterized membrane protein